LQKTPDPNKSVCGRVCYRNVDDSVEGILAKTLV
jgi:hypothetical protein